MPLSKERRQLLDKLSAVQLESRKVLVLGAYDWNFADAREYLDPLGVDTIEVRHPEEFRSLFLNIPDLDFAYAPHWRFLIDKEIVRSLKIIGFHLGRLPRDRGGSPIQHQIAEGRYRSEVCAFLLDEGIDTGPVFCREPFDLSEGSLEEILRRASRLSAAMMANILILGLVPVPQSSGGNVRARRSPGDSVLPATGSPRKIYDHIRMLDCDGYPPAFLSRGEMKIEFSNAQLDSEGLRAVARLISGSEEECS